MTEKQQAGRGSDRVEASVKHTTHLSAKAAGGWKGHYKNLVCPGGWVKKGIGS